MKRNYDYIILISSLSNAVLLAQWLMFWVLTTEAKSDPWHQHEMVCGNQVGQVGMLLGTPVSLHSKTTKMPHYVPLSVVFDKL